MAFDVKAGVGRHHDAVETILVRLKMQKVASTASSHTVHRISSRHPWRDIAGHNLSGSVIGVGWRRSLCRVDRTAPLIVVRQRGYRK